MIKKILTALGISLSIMAVGCQAANQGEEMENPRQMGVSVADQENGFENADNANPQKYGYVRKMKTNDDQSNRHISQLNRDEIANTITSMAVELPNINEAATLVTDNKVLVGYRTDADDKKQTAENVKRTAAAAVPRFYDVYVSDQDGIIKNIARYQNMQSTNQHANDMINDIIKQMKTDK